MPLLKERYSLDVISHNLCGVLSCLSKDRNVRINLAELSKLSKYLRNWLSLNIAANQYIVHVMCWRLFKTIHPKRYTKFKKQTKTNLNYIQSFSSYRAVITLSYGYNQKQEKQCTCNVTLRRVHATTVAVESSIKYSSVCVCERARERVLERVQAYLSSKTRAGATLCSFWHHHIFRHYLINGKIFWKKSLNIKCVF